MAVMRRVLSVGPTDITEEGLTTEHGLCSGAAAMRAQLLLRVVLCSSTLCLRSRSSVDTTRTSRCVWAVGSESVTLTLVRVVDGHARHARTGT